MLFEGKDRRELEQAMKREGRLPPGQSLTLKWPVLHYGSVPRFDPKTWDFRVYGLVESPLKLTWDEFNALPNDSRTGSIASRNENRWCAERRGLHFKSCSAELTRNRKRPTC